MARYFRPKSPRYMKFLHPHTTHTASSAYPADVKECLPNCISYENESNERPQMALDLSCK